MAATAGLTVRKWMEGKGNAEASCRVPVLDKGLGQVGSLARSLPSLPPPEQVVDFKHGSVHRVLIVSYETLRKHNAELAGTADLLVGWGVFFTSILHLGSLVCRMCARPVGRAAATSGTLCCLCPPSHCAGVR